MRIQAFQILLSHFPKGSCLSLAWCIFAIMLLVSAPETAYARAGLQAQQGKCMIHREYKNDKRVMQYFSQDVIEDADAGHSKESCERACKQRGQFLPEEHAPRLRGATNMFFACQYNTMKENGTEYGAVFNATAKVADLTLQKKEVAAKKATGRRSVGARTKRNFEKEASSVPPVQTPSPAVEAVQKPQVIDRYAPLESTTPEAEGGSDVPIADPVAVRPPENFERTRRTIRDPRIN